MKLQKGSNPMKVILANNPDSKIGKLGVNLGKFRSRSGILHIHDGHKACLQALRDEGCDKIVLEFVDATKMGFNMTRRVVTQAYALEECNKVVSADYLIYNHPFTISDETRVLVAERFAEHDYINRLNIPYPEQTIKLMEWVTQRDIKGYTTCRSWKTGTDSWAFKHYTKKYFDIDVLTIDPLEYAGTKVPMSGHTKKEDLTEAFTDFHQLFHDDHTKFTNKQNYIETSDPEFIPNGRTFVSCLYTEDGARVPVAKLI